MVRKSLFVVVFVLLTATNAQAAYSVDLNCDENIDVLDVQLSIILVLELDLSETLDGNGDGVPDACEPLLTEVSCGENTILNGAGDSCEIVPGMLEAATAEGFTDGVASVDITSNDEAVATAAYSNGVASVNTQAFYTSGFADGVASVDITADNQAVADQAFASGVASVNPASFCGSGTTLEGSTCVSVDDGALQYLTTACVNPEGWLGLCCNEGNFLGCISCINSGCPFFEYLNDGYCDASCNTEGCNFDGGDCN